MAQPRRNEPQGHIRLHEHDRHQRPFRCINLCRAVHRIIWKRPTYAHILWEREEIGDFTAKAYEFFRSISGEIAQKKACLILDLDNFSFKQTTNNLPQWFTPELSTIFKDMTEGSKQQAQNNRKETQAA